MKKLRLSYSLLSAWERGDIDGAVAIYLHMDRPYNKAMVKGREFHEDMAKYIEKHGEFPDWLGVACPLGDPKPEIEVIADYSEMFSIKGVYDCLDGDVLYEFKTGGTDSLGWARTWQIPIYFLIAELLDIPIKQAILIHHNKESDIAIIHNTPSKREDARNRIDSLGPDIYDYFKQEGLI